MEVAPADVLYTVLPFFHTNALNTLWQALLVGATYRLRRSLFGQRLLGGNQAFGSNRDVPARRDGTHSAEAAGAAG